MRNPFKRQSHFTEKPTLQDRAAALKISMARLIRGPHRVDLTDQPSSASLPQGSVEDLSATTFIDQQLTRHDVGRGDPDITDCTAAADGHTPHLESAVGRHESFDPNTAIPMSLGVIGTVLPKAEPACAEAGIAAMLSKPEPEFVRVSQAALIEALSGDVSAAVRVAIEDHAHALKAGEDEPDHSDEAFERHSARQNETDERLRSVRCQTLSDLRAKLTYLIPVSRPDLLDQRVGDHLEGLLADIDALSRVQAEPPFVLPAQMPAPGSPEAMALHKAACIEFDRRTHLTDAEYARLKIGDTHTLWTIDTVREVMEGDYSSLMGNEAYAANEKTHAELQELLILTKRREQQFEDAQRDLKLHEVHALAFPDDHEEAGGVGCEDPIHAAIREHKAAYAAWLPHLRATNETLLSNPIYSDLEAAAEAPGDREKEAFDALSEVLPTTREGLLALASYLPGAVLRNSCTNADSDAMHALGAMCGAVKELVKFGRINSPDEDADLHSLPHTKMDPIFAALAESRHLYADWMGAYDAWPHPGLEPRDVLARIDGGSGAFMDHLSETVLKTVPTSLTGCAALGRYVMELFEREEIDGDEHGKLGLKTIVEGLRALPVKAVAAYPPMHADEISLARMVVDYFGNEDIDPRLNCDIAVRDRARAILAAASVPSVADQIITGWRAWSLCPDGPEDGEDAARLEDRRSELLDAAEVLPATPENLPAKALALAWFDYVNLWISGQSREDYDLDGRLALDTDAAICGRLHTGA